MCNKFDQVPVQFEEALDRTGNGLYNVLLLATCALILLGIGIDLFGFSLVVASACDLELSLVQKSILTSLPFIGILLVSYIWGYVSDTKGRRYTLMISLHFGFLLSCLSSLSPNWMSLGLMKFFSVCFSCAANSVSYTLVGESCVRGVRSKYMLLMTCFLLISPAAAGVLSYPTLKLEFTHELSLVGVTFRPWRLLTIILALPIGLGALAIYFFFESPKFLANRGKESEALDIMRRIYAVNHRSSENLYDVSALLLEEDPVGKRTSLLRSLYEQSAPLFREPYLWRTIQLFYIVAVVYITNNSFLVWLPHVLNLVKVSLDSNEHTSGNICYLITLEGDLNLNSTNYSKFDNLTDTYSAGKAADICLGYMEENVIYTLITSQCTFAFLNFIISFLQHHRKKVLITTLCLSALGGICLNLTPDPIISISFFVLFTCTCLGMGIMASYFVDLYSTSHRGMVTCLSIMVGRSATFFGINLVGNLLFKHCQYTFYFWSFLVLSSVGAAFFLPPDN